MRFRLFILLAFVALASCTTFQEEALNVFEIDRDFILLESGVSVQTVTLKSGSKWDITYMPRWVKVLSIKETGNPFEWRLDLSVSANEGTDGRNSTMEFKNLTSELSLKLNQTGRPMVHVSSISLPSTKSIELGSRLLLNPTIMPDDADDKSVTWSSSNSFVVSVDNYGYIEALSAGGPVTITAKTNDGGLTARCVVSVNVPVSGITFDCGGSLTIEEGSFYYINATVTPSNATDKSLIWTSSNEAVATVNSVGRVRANNVGSTIVRAASTSTPNVYAECRVVVTKANVKVASVSLSPSSVIMYRGDGRTISATVSPGNATDKTLTWSSSNTSVVTVDSYGYAMAVGKGSATITARASNGVKGTCSVEVRVHASSVSLSRNALTLYENQSYTLAATVLPSDAYDKSVSWSSSDSNVAYVSQSGRVTAYKKGNAIISVRTNDGNYTAECAVEVKTNSISVTGMTLSSYSFNVPLGRENTVTVSISPSNADNKDVEWIVEKPQVVTVTPTSQNSAVLKARDGGSTTITVRSVDNPSVYRTINYTVTFSKPSSVDLGLPSGTRWASFNVGANKQSETGIYYSWGDIFIREDFSWSGYLWCDGNYSRLTKYNTNPSYGAVDNLVQLKNSDDVACVRLGGRWRMPTKADWEELLENCTIIWNSYDGVYGMEAQKNGKSVFFPVTGYYSDSDCVSYGVGYYWSSSLRSDDPRYAEYGFFQLLGETTVKREIKHNIHRCRGFAVRAVYK